jgi:N-acetylglucosaminyl-diphospho-decaprenol L-rhamnosyltransferase
MTTLPAPVVDVSVIVVSFNTRAMLDACLASIVQPDLQPVSSAAQVMAIETIVVDNGSNDGSVGMARTRYAGVQVVEMGQNVGFARACNAGIRASSGRYVVLLNSDTVVLDYALDRLAGFLDGRPEIAVAGPKLLNRDGSLQASCFAFTTVRDVAFEQLGLTVLFPDSPFFNRRGLGGFDRTTVREVDWVSGACLMARRSAIDRAGSLDEGFFMYGEELDWCVRMKHAGLRVAFYPGATVMHYGRGSSLRARSELAPRALAGRLRYFRKHHGALAAVAVRVLTVIGMSLRLISLPVQAIVRPAVARAKLPWYVGLLRAALSPHLSESVSPPLSRGRQ